MVRQMVLFALLGFVLIALVLRDSFMTILLPRTVRSRWRFTNPILRTVWQLLRKFAKEGSPREDVLLSTYGPFSISVLMTIWALLLILGFALVHFGLGIELNGKAPTLGEALYASGVTFFTLGFGDMVSGQALGRLLAVAEAGLGFAFLAVVISYLPVLYNLFSRRETLVILMDARAGSPPSGGEMLLRFAQWDDPDGLVRWLERWETWSSELLESHLSYPTLAFYRSQHSDTSWLKCLTAVMDACALMQLSDKSSNCARAAQQAHLTFAMCRHAVVDLSQIFGLVEIPSGHRLSFGDYQLLCASLNQFNLGLDPSEAGYRKLHDIRESYEPYVTAMSEFARLPLPKWFQIEREIDNWQSGSWGNQHLD